MPDTKVFEFILTELAFGEFEGKRGAKFSRPYWIFAIEFIFNFRSLATKINYIPNFHIDII